MVHRQTPQKKADDNMVRTLRAVVDLATVNTMRINTAPADSACKMANLMCFVSVCDRISVVHRMPRTVKTLIQKSLLTKL